MKPVRRRAVFVTLLIMAIAFQGQSADLGRVLRSCVFPGIGQLGDGQRVKGLSFMVVEAALLTLTVSEVSKTNAFARETEYLQVKYQMADTYEDRLKQYSDWQDAYDKSGSAKTMIMAYGAAAGVVWALNIVDAIIFPPKGGSASVIEKLKNNTLVMVGPENASVTYRLTF